MSALAARLRRKEVNGDSASRIKAEDEPENIRVISMWPAHHVLALTGGYQQCFDWARLA